MIYVENVVSDVRDKRGKGYHVYHVDPFHPFSRLSRTSSERDTEGHRMSVEPYQWLLAHAEALGLPPAQIGPASVDLTCLLYTSPSPRDA